MNIAGPSITFNSLIYYLCTSEYLVDPQQVTPGYSASQMRVSHHLSSSPFPLLKYVICAFTLLSYCQNW